MTIHHLHGVRRDGQPPAQQQTPEPQPTRHGQPWTTDDHEILVARCREGASASELAEALERTEPAVVTRAKRLLPVDQRGAPEDHVIPHLRRLLQEDGDYDWGTHLAATPPPRPVINHLPAPQVRRGIPGLHDNEVLAIAELMARLGPDRATDPLRRELASEIRRRGLAHTLEVRLTEDAEGWLEDLLWSRQPGHYRDDVWGTSPHDGPYDIGPAEEPEFSGQWSGEEPPW